jgi:hypothetical protein
VAGVIPPVPGEDGSPPRQHTIIPCQPAAWRRQRRKKQSHSQLGHFSFSHSKGSDIYLLVEAEEDWVRER